MSFFTNFRSTTANIVYKIIKSDLSNTHDFIGNVQAENVSAVYTSIKILSENIARIPIVIKKNNRVDKEHYLNKYLGFKPNLYTNIFNFKSIIEYKRNYEGNVFVKILRHENSGKITGFEVLNTKEFEFKFVNNSLFIVVDDKVIKYEDVLHLKGVSGGLIGTSPITAANNNIQVLGKAGKSLNNFYTNGAQNRLVLETDLSQPNLIKKSAELNDDFKDKYSGSNNSDKLIVAPPNSKIKTLDTTFADAQLIETMRFTRDEIASIFGIPNYLLNNSDSKSENIEQDTLNFLAFTLSPILSQYKNELEFKLLTQKDIEEGYSIDFDTSVIKEIDQKTRIINIALMISKGLITYNEALEKLGHDLIVGEAGEYHFTQSQNQALEKYNEWKNNDLKSKN